MDASAKTQTPGILVHPVNSSPPARAAHRRRFVRVLACQDVRVASVVDRAIELLHEAGVTLEAGLSDDELAGVESVFGFSFSPDHRELLATTLPTGDRWVNWRSDPAESIGSRVAWPIDGVIFDVRHNAFWPQSWGPRPPDPEQAEIVARRMMAIVPLLAPLYGHRFMPASPAPAGSPVFSVYQTDVIYYGNDLADYFARELKVGEPAANRPAIRIAFWSDLAEGAPPERL